ncbi:MAG TPA: TMEM175 family protein [Frateuria sp.]|uniref:TMEM175 family protein n=1 Tax=Frateuria sp. TaxID=2211372 RepID=UPI002DF3BCE6|nr:TMEM175 family protein [Frateuria sp.]
MSLTEQREGIEAGRLDMLVDGAFAFTLTLLVIGGNVVPRGTAELLQTLGNIPAFAVCFLLIMFFWHGHVRWRHCCMQADVTGRWLSLLLVFFALIFVYPLHMMFASLFNTFSGGVLPSDFKLVSLRDVRTLFVVYGIAFTCMAGTLVLLFGHAARRARREGRSPLDAQRERLVWTVPTVLGLGSALLAVLMPASSPPLSWGLPGMLYSLMFLIGPLTARFRRRHARA